MTIGLVLVLGLCLSVSLNTVSVLAVWTEYTEKNVVKIKILFSENRIFVNLKYIYFYSGFWFEYSIVFIVIVRTSILYII